MLIEMQFEKAQTLRRLHKSLLVLPNIWDPIGARLVEQMGFPAVATASAAISWSKGYSDNEQIPFKEMLSSIQTIVASTMLPVTADIEGGYSDSLPALKEKIQRLIEAGIVGINIEDFNHRAETFFSIEEQCERLELITWTAKEMGIPLFINARIDVFIKSADSIEKKLETLLKRGNAYTEAGADCIFPIGVKEPEILSQLTASWNRPVNVLYFPGVPPLETLKQLKVKRVSFGPGLLKIVLSAMKNFLQELSKGGGLVQIESATVTSDDITNLLKND